MLLPRHPPFLVCRKIRRQKSSIDKVARGPAHKDVGVLSCSRRICIKVFVADQKKIEEMFIFIIQVTIIPTKIVIRDGGGIWHKGSDEDWADRLQVGGAIGAGDKIGREQQHQSTHKDL